MEARKGNRLRRARPRSGLVRGMRVTVRFTALELDQLRQLQQGTGSATLSAYLRLAGLGLSPPARTEIPQVNLVAYRQLGEVALDLRQLGTNLNTIAVRLLTVAGGERPLVGSLAARLPALQTAVEETRSTLKALRQDLVGTER